MDPTPSRLLRRPDVEHRTGLARSTIYALVARGLFPRPVKLRPAVGRRRRQTAGRRRLFAHGWDERDVDEWIAVRPMPVADGFAEMLRLFEIECCASRQHLLGPEIAQERAELMGTLRRAFAMLNPREEMILRLRFGLDGCKEHTLAQVGAVLTRHVERIRQIECRALRKLRWSILVGSLRVYAG